MNLYNILQEIGAVHKPKLSNRLSAEILKPDSSFRNADGTIMIELILDAPELYRKYPWILDSVNVKFVNSIDDGSEMKIVTLGGGEGTVLVNLKYWKDAIINPKDPHRKLFLSAVVHELGHAVDDKNDTFDTSNVDGTRNAEEFANAFQKHWVG